MTKNDKKAKAKAKAKKPDQLKIPGTERKDRIPELDKAAEEFLTARDARTELTLEMAEKKTELDVVMGKHAVTRYVFEAADGSQRIVRYGKAPIKVEKAAEPKTAK
ncbi:MAG TPA: hypothetical protein VGM39_08620 [Kofleriaceae bacterium]|jgi:hypothetical protein